MRRFLRVMRKKAVKARWEAGIPTFSLIQSARTRMSAAGKQVEKDTETRKCDRAAIAQPKPARQNFVAYQPA